MGLVVGSGCHDKGQGYVVTILDTIRTVFEDIAGCFVSLPGVHSMALL